MGRLIICGLLLLSALTVVRADEELPEEVKDPFYGQVLFDFYQQNYFSAITHLQVSQQQNRLLHEADEAELLLGGLYLSYGMQKNAEAIFNQLLARQVDPQLRNRVWLALAGIYNERGYEAKAAELLKKIEGPLPPQQQDERLLLETTLLTHRGQYAEAAELLKGAKRDSLERAYAQYNLAMEQIRLGHEAEGRALLEPLAQLDAAKSNGGDAERTAVRDKANLSLGFSHLRREQFVEARGWFEKVGLNGPFATQALLGLGWVEAGLGNATEALSVWLPLTQRHSSDPSVLEGLLAVPYTLTQLGDRQQAAENYKKAIDAYDSELKTLEGIISGMNFSAVARELVNVSANPEAGWQWRADISASSTLGPYLYQVMAGREFQEALRNYRDLLYLDRRLERWQSDLDAYEAMVDTRQAAYEERLPKIRSTLAKLHGNDFQRQRDLYAKKIAGIEVANDAEGLANGDELKLMERLAKIEARMERLEGGVDLSAQQQKFEVLKGVLLWRQETEYPVRLWQTKRQLQQLDATLKASDEQHQSLTVALKRTPNDFERYRQTIKSARIKIVDMRQQAKVLEADYEDRLQQLTVTALKSMEARIKEYQGQALFAAAQIYDGALHAQRGQ